MSNIKFVKFIDRVASFFIKCGGVIVISCVALIIFMIFKVAFPLFLSPTIKLKNHIIFEDKKIVEIGLGEYQNYYFTFSENSVLDIFSLENTTKPSESIRLRSDDQPILKVDHISKDIYAIQWSDGESIFAKIYSKSVLVEGKRINKLSYELIVKIKAPYLNLPQMVVSSIDIEKGEITRAYCDDQKIYLNIYKFEADEKEVELEGLGKAYQIDIGKKENKFITISANGEQLWVASRSGHLMRYKVGLETEPKLTEELALNKEISCIGNVYGDYTLLVAQTDGELNSWFPVRLQQTSEKKTIIKSHHLLKTNNPIIKIQGSFQDKSYLAFDSAGSLYQGHLTTEKNVFSLKGKNISCFGLANKGDGLIALSNKEILIYEIENPYHEVSISVLFQKVWYENYSKPEYVWQSGGGGDDSEGKLSLIPLIFGTLKGTFYAMLLSVPLALGSAIYISQFASSTLRSFVKPAVEMMSAIPSVVVGFIAALWLAPKVDDNFFLVFLSLPLFMVIFFLNLLLWSKFAPNGMKKNAERGFHLIYLLPALLATFFLLYYVGPLLEEILFHGAFKNQMIRFFSVQGYEQRNCLIIGFALGFTVIPIIFSIAEDVLSTVPRSLMANSLALGANRWQTVWRVMLPSASPGIIAGVIIGLGRAIGETMIVMMATGNTPIMDGSIFNGMRTLSANIAVEIGEAPFEGSLYRTLFLSAVILFVMTFILNTGAELIRQALRKKYSQF